jgi:hypothetical protein
MSPAGTALLNRKTLGELLSPPMDGGEPFVAVKVTTIEPSPPPSTPRQRKFLPGVADLVDRLTISLQKQIFVTGQAEHYKAEVEDIIHDIDLIATEEGYAITADAIRWIAVIQLANRFIWENEAQIRSGSATLSSEELAKRLQATHMINGVRNSAKNMLAKQTGGRLDFKIDCFAADEAWNAVFGNWNIFTT